MKQLWREYGWTAALLAATLLVLFSPFLFRGKILLPSDLIDTMTLPFSHYFSPQRANNSLVADGYLQFYPLKYLTQQAYRQGQFAFWNPNILNGYPSYVDGMWTYNVLTILPFFLCFLSLLAVPLFVAGMGMYALLRAYRVRPGVARIFAATYMLNALFITQLLAHFIPAAFSFAPFVLLFLLKYHRTQKFLYLALASISLALGFLAGNIQTVGFLAFLVIIYWCSLWIERKPATFGALVRPIVAILFFASGLAAILVLPTLELFHETMSGGAFFSTSLLRSYSILQRIESLGLALTFFIPQLAGTIRGVTLDQAIGVYAQDFEGAIGFIPLFFAVWAACSLWKKNRDVRPFVVLMIAGLFLPIFTPLFRFIYHRFFVIFILGSCGAGAIGMETMLSENEWDKSIRKWTKVFAVALIAIVALLTIFSIYRIFDYPAIEHIAHVYLLPRLKASVFAEGNAEWVQNRFQTALDYWRIGRLDLLAGIVSTTFAILLLWRKDRLRTRTFLILSGSITVVQLIGFAHWWLPILDVVKYPLYPNTPETRLLQAQSQNSRVYFYREIDTTKQFAFMDNENIVYGIPEATGYESMTPRCLYIYTAILHWNDSGLISPTFLGKFNIGTVVRVKPLPFDSLELPDSNALWIYRNPHVTPRAFLAHDAQVLQNDTDILEQLADNNSTWPAAYFTSEEHVTPIHTRAHSNDRVAIIQQSNNVVEITARSSDSSYLVLTDTYYPGWKAFVDGKQVPVLRCNYTMRTILLSPGMHDVSFRFQPDSFKIGAWISAGTALALLIVGLVQQQKNKSTRLNNSSISEYKDM